MPRSTGAANNTVRIMGKHEVFFWTAVWLALGAIGATWLSRAELNALQQKFEADSRIVHRLLTQRTVQHDTILATLAASATGGDARCAENARQQIMRTFPHIIAVLCDGMKQAWPPISRSAVALDQGRYWLALDGGENRWALQVDILKMIPHSEWPSAPIHVELRNGHGHVVLQKGMTSADGWEFQFSKKLSSDSQPFTLTTRQHAGWSDLPWASIAAWLLAVAAALGAVAAWRLQSIGRRRAEHLLRLRKVERLNTLGELAAGMAHELNQPLTAILANSQAANRLLKVEPPDLDKTRDAIAQTVVQAKRAAQVITRLRDAIGQPGTAGRTRDVSLNEAVNNALHLLAPEIRSRQVALTLEGCSPAAMVNADPVELDQILHNLLWNALQALEQVGSCERRLQIRIESQAQHACVRIADSGPGIPPAALSHLFEPFFTTRKNGLGLGLSLCETLAGGMGGTISAANRAPRGAEFLLSLPQPG
ncbi:MAG TPA: ATP-binding protein [Noviherbaspirillum sp.]|nr:ATP-binding protein [Noviherbaspirillum sp.]